MSIRANLNRLEPEIETLKNRVQEIESCLIVSNVRENEAEKNEEQLEHRVNNVEDLHNDLEKRVIMLQQDVRLLQEYLNAAITRINVLHGCLNEYIDKDLRCDEKLVVSDDDDDGELEFIDYSNKIDQEVVKIQQMRDNPEQNK